MFSVFSHFCVVTKKHSHTHTHVDAKKRITTTRWGNESRYFLPRLFCCNLLLRFGCGTDAAVGPLIHNAVMKCWNDIPKFFFIFIFGGSSFPPCCGTQTHTQPRNPRYIQKRVKIQIREKEWLKEE